MRRQHIEGLELVADVAEHAPQILANAGRKLIDQKQAVGLQHAMSLAQDALAQRRGDGAERDP
jgi:hypothetical protein